MPATVTGRGQVTVPKSCRDLVGTKPVTQASFELHAHGRVYIVNANGDAPRESRFAKLIGIARPGTTTDEVMEMTRGTD